MASRLEGGGDRPGGVAGDAGRGEWHAPRARARGFPASAI